MRPWEDKTAKAGFLSSLTENEARSWMLAQIEQELRTSLIRDRGLTAQKIMPGTDGQVMVSDEENGALYSEWGRVDPTLGVSPQPGAKVCFIDPGAGIGQRCNDNAFAYADFNTTVYNIGCTIDTSGIGDYGAGTTNPQNNYIQVPTAGRYHLSGSLLWYQPSAAVRVGAGFYLQNAGELIALELVYEPAGLYDFSVNTSTIHHLSANEKVSMYLYFYWGGGGHHVLRYTNDANRYNWMAVDWAGPSS